jgi:acetyl esterase/lipase
MLCREPSIPARRQGIFSPSSPPTDVNQRGSTPLTEDHSAARCALSISFIEPWTHQASKTNLLGEAPDPAVSRSLSSETQVTAQTPPAFIYHTNADTTVPVENAIAYFLALRKSGVPAEIHVFREGRHGTGLSMGDPALSEWPRLLANWLRVSGFAK